MNFTWREGFYVWGHGQVLNRTGEEFGLGHHNLTLQVSDPWGETEYSYIEFDVLKSVSIDASPFVTGSAITEEDATYTHNILLPHLGKNYGIGGGDSPLMLVDVSIDAASSDDPGLRSLDLSLNLS